MKKVLSLVLAFAMILGSFGFVFASDFPDVSDTEYFSEPVNVLSGLGVIGGFPDGTFGPEKEVTRAQMATMIVNALGMTVTGQADTKFKDVPKAHWASGFINYAASVGFIAGFPDGTFKPDQQVTYDQALTMIVAALGYKSESLTGTWPGNFVNMARGLGILDICKTTGTANAPRQDIACFLYSALTSPIGYTDKDGAFHQNVGADGNVGSDNMLARLGAKVRLGDDKKELFFVIEGTEDAKINLKNYMGAYASVYEDKNGDIVAVKEIKSEFIEGTIKDLKDDYKMGSTKQAAADIYKSFKNGDVDKTDVAYDSLSETVKLAVKKSGKTISEVYSMQVWADGQTFMAEADIQDYINAKTPKINGVKFALDEDDKIDTSSFVLNGVTALGDIKEDDVVTVYRGSDSTVARVDVSDKTVVGVITKVDKDGNYTIKGEVYGLNANPKTSATDLKKLMNDETEATYYLDYAGDIFYADAEASTTDYAVVLDLGAEGGSWSSDKGTKKIRLFLADGTSKDYIAGGDFADTIDATTKTSTKCKIGELVKYTLNKKDQITNVEAVTSKTDITFDVNGVGLGKVLKDTTIVFNYSGEDKTEEKAKADNYSIVKAADLFDKEVKNVYAKDKDGSYEALLAIKFQAADKIYTFFVKEGGSNKDGKIYTALYDGEVKEFTVTVDKAPELFTTGTAVSYTLTFEGEEVSDFTTGTAITKVGQFNGDKKGTFSGNVYTYGDENFSMDKDAVVYVKDGSAWSVEKASYLAKSAEYFSDILLFKTDKLVDIVVVIVR